MEYIAEFPRTRPGELEIVNLLEPHKLIQKSVTILRRTSGARPRQWGTDDGARADYPRIQAAAAAHVTRARSETDS